jgi:hypothetical protein
MSAKSLLRALVVAAVVAMGAPAWAQPGRAPSVPGTTQPQDVPERVKALYQEYPVIELVTMGIGSLMWERHGHIALCVRYENPGDDVCYNYGIGDFKAPIAMAAGFFRGTKSFWVGKQDPKQMLSLYKHFDRTIWVQPLPLTAAQKTQIIEKLEYDVLEEHKHYAYDHFWDNCTTRVRDILDDATGGALRRLQGKTYGRTYRDLARDGFQGMRVPLIITDVAMGRVTDAEPTYWDRMFLPDYLRDAVRVLWGIEPIVLYQRQTDYYTLQGQMEIFAQRIGLPPPRPGTSGRLVFTLIILALTAPAWLSRLAGRFQRTGLGFSLAFSMLLGSILWFLAIISPLPYVRWNESLLFLLPLDLLLVRGSIERRRKYAVVRIGMIAVCALLMLANVLTQPIWPLVVWALVPLATVAFLQPDGKLYSPLNPFTKK